MAKNKKTPRHHPKPLMFGLNAGQLAGWLGLLVFVCGWFFVLGIIVGRSTTPAPQAEVSVEKHKETLLAARKKALKGNARQPTDNHLIDYHEKLTKNQEEPAPSGQNKEPPKGQATPSAPRKTAASSETTPKADMPPANGSFTIQVAAMQKKIFADRFLNELKKKAYNPYMETAEGPDGSVWYRVRCGAFKKRAAAELVLARLRKDGYSPLLIKK